MPTRRECSSPADDAKRVTLKRGMHKGGRIVPLAWSGVWSEPEQRHFFFGRDMTERKAAEEQLRQLAHFDQLTGLPNRVSLRKDTYRVLRAA
jgi:predicted signal transduction protein with EAL and GGDEF domain